MNRFFLILVLILIAVFWIWWLPGLRVANDFSFVSNDWLKLQFDIPRVWNERGAEGFGEYGVFILWSYPINFVFGILANLGLTFQIWERVLIFSFILLGSFSIWKLLSTYSLSNKSKLIGSLFYLVNTYPVLLIDGGQISIALAYGIFPFVYLKAYQAVQGDLHKKILAGLMISILGFFDIRFIFVLFLLLLVKSLFELSFFWKWVKTFGVFGLVIVLLNAYWFIAYLMVPMDKNILTSLTQISANLMNIGHSILLISPHWYKNVFGQIAQLNSAFILIPLLVFLAPIIKRKDKIVAFWLLIAAISIFLAKGGSEPMPSAYQFLHANVLGFSFFRDSTKFFFLISLSYAVLISIVSEEIFKKINIKIQSAYLIFMISYFIFLIKPVFLNQMTGAFSVQLNEKDFQSTSLLLQKDNNFGRVFWIPSTSPLSYSDLNHPIVEASRVFNKIPFSLGVKGSYETFNFLREASYMGEIFDVAGISYIAYPYPDIRRSILSSDEKKYYYTFLDQLAHLSWIERVVSESKVPLLKTRNHQDKIFITKNTWIVLGSDEIFVEATKSAKLKLSDNAVIFAESYPEMGSLITKHPEAKIILNRKAETDLLASFIPKKDIIFPALQLTIKPNHTGWWKNDGTDLISWRDFLQSKYGIDNKDFDLGGGWAVGENNLEFKIQNSKFKKNNILLTRVMESSRSGNIGFYQGNDLIGQINTKQYNTNVRWLEIGALPKDGDITIKTTGDINVINAIALTDPQDFLMYKAKIEELVKQVSDYKPENISEDSSVVTYQKINQTKYKITVSNLVRPEILVFSSSFHSGWKLDGQSSIPIYGFLNGFRVDKNGEYILAFKPQKYVYLGLLISGSTGMILLMCLIRVKFKDIKRYN